MITTNGKPYPQEKLDELDEVINKFDFGYTEIQLTTDKEIEILGSPLEVREWNNQNW